MSAETTTSLVEQAKDHRRDDVMENVVGPALTGLLYATYGRYFSDPEVEQIPADSSFPDLSDLVWAMKGILGDRRQAQIHNNPQAYREIEELKDARDDLFAYPELETIMSENINSGIMIPLVVAVDILRIESGDQPRSRSLVLQGPVDHKAIIEIMRRDSFTRVLRHLPKGPNGFVGGVLADPREAFSLAASGYPMYSERADAFFGFKQGYEDEEKLSIWDAYKVENGRVVDLSDAYHMSAQAKRQEVGKRHSMVFSRGSHEIANSSGCPVRHTFDEWPESLISASKNFVIATLEIAERKTVQADIARLLAELLEPTAPEAEPEQSSRLKRLGSRLLRRNMQNV